MKVSGQFHILTTLPQEKDHIYWIGGWVSS